MASASKASKTSKAGAGKAPGQQDDKPVKVTLYVAAKLAKSFATHAVQTGQNKSELFAEMIATHCRRFVVHDHAKESAKRSDDEGGVGLDAEDAA
jgi:hypothetical protein